VPSPRWELLKDLLEIAGELRGDERLRYLQTATRGDADLLARMRALLAEADSADDGFLVRSFPPESQVPEPPDPRVGKAMGSYRVRRLIARGGYSSLYEASRADGLFTRTVALKFAQTTTAGVGRSSFGLSRLRGEIELLSSIEHRNLCRLFDAGTDSDNLFAVLEFADEGRLLEYCERRRADLVSRLTMFLQLCEAVECLHGRGWFHCDLKPQNVLVRRDGSICLIDLGSALRIGDFVHGNSAPLSRRPALTVSYASPEVISGSDVSCASEVYSLGMILYELVCGGYPYKPSGSLLDQLVRAIQFDDPIPPSAVGKEKSTEAIKTHRTVSSSRISKQFLDDVVLNCLQKVPSDRYLTVSHLAEDIRVLTRGGRPAATSQMEGRRSGGDYLEKPLRVFLAHCKHDIVRVRELHEKLNAIGARPWLDEIDILPGTLWTSAIERAIRTSDVVVVCLSQAYMERIGYLQRELTTILQRAAEHPQDSIFVVPMRFEDCDIPEELKARQWVNYYDDGGFSRLVNALRMRCGQIR
jgi:serine/threonine protein kinase